MLWTFFHTISSGQNTKKEGVTRSATIRKSEDFDAKLLFLPVFGLSSLGRFEECALSSTQSSCFPITESIYVGICAQVKSKLNTK
jgi:hypothetical protein